MSTHKTYILFTYIYKLTCCHSCKRSFAYTKHFFWCLSDRASWIDYIL